MTSAAVVCSGDLYKQGGGALTRLQRRYFELRTDGGLTYFDKRGGEEKGVIYVEGARVVDRGTFQDKLCFSIEGVNLAKGVKEYFLFADDAATKWLWYQNIQRLTKRYDFYQSDSTDGPSTDPRIMRSPLFANCIASNVANQACADCASPNPTWSVGAPFGVLVCIECVGVHRSLWAPLCKEIELDKWEDSDVAYFESRGNNVANAELEFHVPTTTVKPNRWSSRQLRERYICAKYRDKAFTLLQREGEPPLAPQFDTASAATHVSHDGGPLGTPPKYIGVAFLVLQQAEGFGVSGCVAVVTNGFQEVRSKPGIKVDSSTTRWGELVQVGVDHLKRPLYVTLYDGDSKIAATAEVILSEHLEPTSLEAPCDIVVPLTGKGVGEGTKAILRSQATFTKLT